MSEKPEKLDLFGQTFGPYHVGKKIGEGGYAVVYRGTEVDIERDVALKVLKPNQRGEYGETTKKRFMREARMVASLKSQHTVQLYGHGEHDGLLFLAFEYVEGETLSAYLRSNGALKPLQVVKVLEQILEALEEAHDRGLVHRDIKPANIMVFSHNRRGLQAKVLDFGIGKFVREQQKLTQLTAEGRMIGTPRYMSPEQMRGAENLGPGVDIWAVGMIAYELLVGKKAISTSDAWAITSRVLDGVAIELPADLGVPVFLRDIVEKMLRKDVERRYRSASSILRDLEDFRMRASHDSGLQNVSTPPASVEIRPFIEEEETEKRTPGEVPSQKEVQSPPSLPNAEISPDGREQKEENKRKLWTAGVAVVLISLLGGAWMMSRPVPSTNADVPAFLLEQQAPAKPVRDVKTTEVSPASWSQAQEVVVAALSAARHENIKAAKVAEKSALTAKASTEAAPQKPLKARPKAQRPEPKNTSEPPRSEAKPSKKAEPEKVVEPELPTKFEPKVEGKEDAPSQPSEEESPKLRLWGIQ